jgi:hypothetical protein
MKTSTKAVLLSVLVFPGAGHLYLKRGWRGIVFLAPAMVAVIYIFQQAWEEANRIADQILAYPTSLDPVALAAQIEQGSGNTFWANVASAVMLLCWVGAAVDVWMLARQAPRGR